MRTIFSVLLLVLSIITAGCGSAPPRTELRGIKLMAEPGANDNMPAAVDIVFVYDAAAAALLPKTGPEWFEKKPALVAGLAASIDVVSMQVPPARVFVVPLPASYKKAIGVYSYANYLAPAGQPMANLTPYKRITIRLTRDAIVYASN